MYRDSLVARILATFLIVLALSVSAASAWAVVDDYLLRDVMPTGARIAYNDVAGLSRAASERLVDERVKGKLLAPATLHFAEKSFDLDPAMYASIDVQGMLDEALAPKTDAPLYMRVLARVTGARVGGDVPAKMKIDEAKLASTIASIAPDVFVPAVDATLSVVSGGLRFVPEVDGAAVDTTTAPDAVAKALLAGAKEIQLPALIVKPRVSIAAFGKTLFVKLGSRRLTLYEGTQVAKEYDIAIGTSSFPTPRGVFTIVNKRRNPTWSNPGSDWAKSMPARIGPGPGNPLGTRALDLDASGIRIHGTSKDYSIGTAASHGCMRMHRRDVEELFELVPVGTRVIIVS
jgi:lipoprotein-anchoring transpeptidase ErfK/SrfK